MKTKILMLILTCALLDLIQTKALADALYVGAWSKHINPSPMVNNESHNLVAVEYKSYLVTAFKNSFSHDTVAVAKRYELFQRGHFKAGIYLGASYGYKGTCEATDGPTSNERVVCPLVVPDIVYTRYKTQIAVSLMGNAIAIGPKWEF